MADSRAELPIGTAAALPSCMNAFAPLAESSETEVRKRHAIRLLLSACLKLLYRLDVRRMERVPREGPAIIVCNHVSFIDWLFIAVALPRLPHFVMHEQHWRQRTFRWFFDLHHVIPIAPRKDSPERLETALRSIRDALEAGELVMLFPEGDMTYDGELGVLRPGVERIVREQPVPVVPLALRGLWGSFFSRKGGAPMQKLPRRWRATVEVVAGLPLAPEQVTTGRIATSLTALRGSLR